MDKVNSEIDLDTIIEKLNLNMENGNFDGLRLIPHLKTKLTM
jgi:hypothetical protein